MSLLRTYQDENERGVKMDYHFIRGKFTEAELEKAIIELCEQQGYTYVCGEDMHRKYEDILLLDDLRSYLTSSYSGLSDTEMQKIINKLFIQTLFCYLDECFTSSIFILIRLVFSDCFLLLFYVLRTYSFRRF